MFISRPPYELKIPAGLQEPGDRYWRLFELFAPVPWFLATLRFEDDGTMQQRSFSVCWETDVIEMLTATPGATAIWLQLVRPPVRNADAWSLHTITRVWRLREPERNDERPYVVLEDRDGTCLCPLSGTSLPDELEGRELVVDLTRPAEAPA